MTELLKEIYPDEIPRPAQRLDAGTTGVIVFARTKRAAAFLMRQFQEKTVFKEYLALVKGVPLKRRFTINAPIGGLHGSRRGVGRNLSDSKPARTDVEWMSSFKGESLLKVIPLSGRTNQIRVHLASRGLPIVNDPVYGEGRESGVPFSLHARRLRFKCFERLMEVTAACPEQFHPFLEKADRGWNDVVPRVY